MSLAVDPGKACGVATDSMSGSLHKPARGRPPSLFQPRDWISICREAHALLLAREVATVEVTSTEPVGSGLLFASERFAPCE